ncbi:unnamed protein product [Trichogramma brassicae]|uniref:Uncharacterized protein n=1 Tax=Trichogramma brassicae TaxID=86971 RepID=A0A6H5IB26_9HYME|nr:unnamed protein product [Trichogramma brassicae]
MRNIHCSIISGTTRHEKVSNPCRIYTPLLSSLYSCGVLCATMLQRCVVRSISPRREYGIIKYTHHNGCTSPRRQYWTTIRATTKNLNYDIFDDFSLRAKSACAPYVQLLLFLVCCCATRAIPLRNTYTTTTLVRYTNAHYCSQLAMIIKKLIARRLSDSSAGRSTCHRAVCCAVCASAAESNRVRVPRASSQFFIALDRFFWTKCRKIIPTTWRPSSRVLVSCARRYRGSQAPSTEPRLAREASKNRVRAEANKESRMPRAPLSSRYGPVQQQQQYRAAAE